MGVYDIKDATSMLIPVRSEHFEAAWPLAQPFIAAACRRGPLPCDEGELADNCAAGVNQLWIVERDGEPVGAAVTGISSDPTDRVCVWLATGGEFAALREHMSAVEEWAKEQGCIAMRSFSRRGMIKRFPNDYKVRGVIFQKEL